MSKDWTKEEIARQVTAAKSLLEELSLGEDEDAKHDLVEGETMFFEAIERALNEIDECDVMIVGLDEKIKQFQSRKKRAGDRAERLRGMIDQAFHMAEINSHKFARATISIKRVPPKLVVTDEAALPSKFYAPQPPKLDKKALFDAIKAGEEIPGAHKSNGGSTIQIRKD